jgi:uncharacterized protein (TIGR01244 family)
MDAGRALTTAAVRAGLWAMIAAAGGAWGVPPQGSGKDAQGDDPYANVNTVAHDRDTWQGLLRDHEKIRRRITHLPDGVEAVTESDDPAVAPKIIEHAKAMQERMKVGAQVRVWDAVFAELFEKHGAVTIEVTPTDKGVRIVEHASDPAALTLMRAHALGVSEFVREGHGAGGRATPRFDGAALAGELPPPEVSIGGVKHRFLLVQPTDAQLAWLKGAGVTGVVNFRPPSETDGTGERAWAENAGVSYCNPGYAGGADLTDEVFAAGRAALKEADGSGRAVALHCRTGNRVGPVWAAYRVLDQGVELERALSEARAIGMVDPLLESLTRDSIRRATRPGAQGAWREVGPDALTPEQRERLSASDEARSAAFARLLSALSEALAATGPDGAPVGPAGAIGVCKDQAPAIAQAVSRERGVMLGRTSERLRNPKNAAPAWARGVLAEAPATSAPAGPRVFVNEDGSMGMMFAITAAGTCLACHGDEATMNPDVKSALTAAYPRDRATGYKDGDLRGWFWVETPGRSSGR